MTMEKTLVLFLVLSACGVAEPENTGPPQQMPVTSPTDAGTQTGAALVNVTEFCSVRILWNYTDQEVTFQNQTDSEARVTAYRVSDGTVIVRNYLFRDGEDTEDARFEQGEEVRVVVEFLKPNLSLEQFKECGERTYILGR
jgi:hypothetical protein